MGGGADILILFAGEDIKPNQVNLGMAVLASLGGGHFHNLARAALQHDEAVLAQGRTLHGVRSRRPGISLTLELIVKLNFGHGDGSF